MKQPHPRNKTFLKQMDFICFKNNWTQEQFAKALKIHRRTLSLIKFGKSGVSFKISQRLKILEEPSRTELIPDASLNVSCKGEIEIVEKIIHELEFIKDTLHAGEIEVSIKRLSRVHRKIVELTCDAADRLKSITKLQSSLSSEE